MDPPSFSSLPSMHFLAAITSPTRLSQRLFHSTLRNGSQAPSSSHFQHPPPSSSTLGDHNSEQHLPRPSNTFTSMAIFLLVRMKSDFNKHTALLVLSTACATFSKRSLHSAPNSMEHCALFHWILSHFCTLILRVIQFCISSFCVFMNPLNLASLAKFYQHTPNFCTKTINRNTK